MDLDTATALMLRLCGVGVVVTTFELLVTRSDLAETGLMSWRIGRLDSPHWASGYPGRVFARAARYPNVMVVLLLRLLSGCLLLLSPQLVVLNVLTVGLAAGSTLVLMLRNSHGLDGADQMVLVILVGYVVSRVIGGDFAWTVYIWFIAAQASLSYLSAGLAKFSHPRWRDGTYLIGILQTHAYGFRTVAHFVSVRPTIAKMLACGVIGWESCFWVVLIAPRPLTVAFLLGGLVFHVSVALLMGLNDFVWAFVATYPAILFFVSHRAW